MKTTKPSRQSVLTALEAYREIDPAFMEMACPELYAVKDVRNCIKEAQSDLGTDCDGNVWEHTADEREYIEIMIEAAEYILQARKWYRFSEAELEHITRA